MNKKIKELDELEEVDEIVDSDNSEEIKEIEDSIEENEIKTPLLHKPMSFLGLIISIVLVPTLIINIMFLVSIYRNQGKVPDLFGYMPLIILPDYMSPEIQSGDLIISKKTDIEDLHVGDIVSFYIPKGQGTGVATLRVSAIYEENGELLFGTQDSTGEDFILGVSQDNIVGLYTGIRFPILGRIIMFLQSTAGLLIFIGLAVVFFIVYDIIRYRNYRKSRNDEVEALKAELEALRSQQSSEAENIPEEET